MTLSGIVSLAFFFAFAIYAFWGVYTLSLNPKSMLNRVFFAVCFSMCVWTFCFSIANSAPDYETALFWRRMASLGWGTLFGFLLHYILILTEKKNVLKNKWIYLPLYLPGALTVFVFGIFGDLAREQYNLVQSAAGWVNVVNVSASNWWGYFCLYFIGFNIIGLSMLWQWGRSSTDLQKQKQASLLTVSLALAFILGMLTDIIVNNYMSFQVPPLASVFGLFPVTTIFYYGLMGPKISQIVEPSKILSEANLAKLYQIVSMVFIFGGFLQFATQYYFNWATFSSAVLFSTVLIMIAVVLKIIQRLPINADLKENVFILVVSVSIPLISLRFIEYASITVWATAFIALIVSVLSNKQRMIICSGIVILITQIWVGIKVPTAIVQVDGSDHLARMGILSMFFAVAYYANRIYIRQLEENKDQIRFQKMVSQISADFVTVTESNLDEKIKEMLHLCGEYFQADRTYFISLSQKLKTIEWCKEGIKPASELIPALSRGTSPQWMDRMLNSGVIHIPDVETLPPEADEEKAMLKQRNIKSLLAIPVTDKGRILGLLLLASLNPAYTWREDYQELLKILANLLADALVKVEAEKEINYMAYYDGLTGLPNRTSFKNRLEQEIRLARRTGKLIGVVFLDLDIFKAINDAIGHDGGDEILKQVAYRLSRCVRKYDTVARFGGDEFLISLNQVLRVEDILEIADCIMKTFDQPFTVKNQEFYIGASAGIAVYPADGEETEILIQNADMAMYVSKNKGKNQYTICSPAMKKDMLKKMQLANSLYKAQERNELMVHYQPQVNTLTKEIIGVEALIRWNHPELGMIPPSTFIPLAEQTGLINSIGQWVLRTACRQNKEWQDMGLPPLRMAVNLSVEQFRDPNLISIITRTLSETGMESKYLELEITESTALHEASYIIPVLHELKGLGISITIDDFGTEYSSLSRLKMLPVDRIKIDMQFVQGISEGNEDETIAKTIIQLARNLKLDVIAEGVETESQLEFFSKQMCEKIQGFYFYKPLPATEVEKILFEQFKEK